MYSLINLRILVKVLITLTSIISFACRPDQKFNIADKADLAITNVTLIDGTGSEAQQNANIYIKDGRIVEIDAFEPVFKKSVEPMLRHHMGFESL